ncbi:MAG: alpha/beta fold hydrolase [Ilumatobacteraceae bacterium]|nr:alpha/beta fold hydrolase [Ilumatobacteraceae bacterium]
MNSVLAHEVIGMGDDTVVFVHGFTQTRASWRVVADLLVARVPNVRCVLVDLPGHGESRDVSLDLVETAAQVVSFTARATYVGYSLGARVVAQAVAHHPARVVRAALVSGTAGIEESSQRSERAGADDALAERIIRIGVTAFLDEWLAQPLFADLSPAVAQLVERRSNTAPGLADSLRRCGQGQQAPLWDELARSSVPLLAIAGSRDVKYVQLARRLAANTPHGTLRIIDGAGHSAHLEQPQTVAEELRYWMTNPTT